MRRTPGLWPVLGRLISRAGPRAGPAIGIRSAGGTAAGPKRILTGPEVAVGTKMGALEDTDAWRWDGPYRGCEDIPDWVYREPYPQSPYLDRAVSMVTMTLFWAWVFYHYYYFTGHIVGEFPTPYLDKFTDEELGIPPDSDPDPEYWGDHQQFSKIKD